MRPEQVSGRWVHVQEEDTEEQMVFLPADSDLPPARGRMAFEEYTAAIRALLAPTTNGKETP